MQILKVWDIKGKDADENILKLCGGNRVFALLLQNRGINTEDKIKKFLNPLTVPLSSPDVFTDMQKASERIIFAINNNENITVYGDFDADGVTSASILYLTLKELGANVNYYLPDRMTESHGLNTKALVNIISKQKSKLIITVDCGISNVDEIRFAKGFKADVIITDHHEAPDILPDAYAIINPKAPNSIDSDLTIEEIDSLNKLSGAGVAFKLACNLLKIFGKEDFVHEILPLAAVGTIGDIVELIGENRSIVEMGLELIRNGRHIGIQKLLQASGISDISHLTSENITYSVVPRINAAGRLDNPISALNLLISKDNSVIENSVKILNDLNQLRQNLCNDVFEQALSMFNSENASGKNSVILYSKDWHVGIIGIVASKLVEIYNKPVFLMTSDENNPNIIRCSCRSIDGVNIHEILSQHKEYFEGFGGHKMAAGFSFDVNKISFEKFKSLLQTTIEEYTQNIDFSLSTLKADMEIIPEEITAQNIEIINKFQPFGAGNPPPLFVMKNVKINNYKQMGQNNNHLKLFVSKDNSCLFECVKWNTPEFNLPVNSYIDILFSLSINSYNGESNVQLLISDFKSEILNKKEIKVLDHRNKKNILFQVLDFINSTKKTTAVFLGNSALIKELNLPENIKNKLFSSDNIPSNTEQIMFFDCPALKSDFNKIIKNADAKIVHLMNFDIPEINTDTIITKLSGMLKYAVSNLEGKVNLQRAANALCIDKETLETLLLLFENCNMIVVSKVNNDEISISSLKPIELSKIKQDELYCSVDERINDINEFRKFYLNSSIEGIKEIIQG